MEVAVAQVAVAQVDLVDLVHKVQINQASQQIRVDLVHKVQINQASQQVFRHCFDIVGTAAVQWA